MRIARLIVIGALVLAATGAAEAGWLGSKQPKAISLVDRGRVWTANRMSHPMREFKYNRADWGLSKQVVTNRPNHMHPYLRGY